jgi:Cu/Ag efflux protein CusF
MAQGFGFVVPDRKRRNTLRISSFAVGRYGAKEQARNRSKSLCGATSPLRAMKSLWSVVLTALLMFACGPSDPPVRRYPVRGVVTQVTTDRGELSVAIHHERIASFEDRDGKRSAMASMQMLFGVASDVPHALFQPGAKLAFDFEVRWSRQPTLLIVSATALGAETQLELEQGH